jgi:hypothetical protein
MKKLIFAAMLCNLYNSAFAQKKEYDENIFMLNSLPKMERCALACGFYGDWCRRDKDGNNLEIDFKNNWKVSESMGIHTEKCNMTDVLNYNHSFDKYREK